MAFIRCPQCNTVIEKPATGNPICPSCGFGAPKAPAKTAAKKTASKTAAKATAPAAPPPPVWDAAPPAPLSPPSPYATPSAFSPPGENMLQRNSGKAVAALVLGIVSCCIWVVPFIGAFLALPCGILALVFGILGLREVKRDPATFKGGGMAITGIILGSIMILIGLVILLAVTIGLTALDDYCEENPDNPACEDYEENQSVSHSPAGTGLLGERPAVAAFLAQPWRA